MSDNRRFRGSWEQPRDKGEVHSPQGVKELKNALREGFRHKYIAIAERMWKWEFPDQFSDCMRMSYGYVPEKWLMINGRCRVFMEPRSEQLHILPCIGQGGLNIYGNFIEYRVQPTATNAATDHIREMVLTDENSVEIRNDIFGCSDLPVIEKAVDLMVDNIITLNTRQLIAKVPFVFNVSEDNLLAAKNYFRELCEDHPVIYTNSQGENVSPLDQVKTDIDPALLDLYGKWESIILEQLGVPGSMSNSKRAQQTVDEVQLFAGDDKNTIRRQEKLDMRQQACERMKELWGVDVTVTSVIDSDRDNMQREDSNQEDEGGDGDE